MTTNIRHGFYADDLEVTIDLETPAMAAVLTSSEA